MQLSTLSKVWCQLKEYFSSGDAAIYEALQDLMDVQSVIDDFRNAPALETEPTVSADQSQPGVSAQKTSQRSRSGLAAVAQGAVTAITSAWLQSSR